MIYFCTGGCRSGKSAFAQQLAESLGDTRTYVATAMVLDDGEMRERIALHRQARGKGWTHTEPCGALWRSPATHIADACAPDAVLLFDCLTLWVSGCLMDLEDTMGDRGAPHTATLDDMVMSRLGALLGALRERSGPSIIVSNELGMGMVPPATAGRHFRDLAGKANQMAAGLADCAVFIVSGLPLLLKGELPALSARPPHEG